MEKRSKKSIPKKSLGNVSVHAKTSEGSESGKANQIVTSGENAKDNGRQTNEKQVRDDMTVQNKHSRSGKEVLPTDESTTIRGRTKLPPFRAGRYIPSDGYLYSSSSLGIADDACNGRSFDSRAKKDNAKKDSKDTRIQSASFHGPESKRTRPRLRNRCRSTDCSKATESSGIVLNSEVYNRTTDYCKRDIDRKKSRVKCRSADLSRLSHKDCCDLSPIQTAISKHQDVDISDILESHCPNGCKLVKTDPCKHFILNNKLALDQTMPRDNEDLSISGCHYSSRPCSEGSILLENSKTVNDETLDSGRSLSVSAVTGALNDEGKDSVRENTEISPTRRKKAKDSKKEGSARCESNSPFKKKLNFKIETSSEREKLHTESVPQKTIKEKEKSRFASEPDSPRKTRQEQKIDGTDIRKSCVNNTSKSSGQDWSNSETAQRNVKTTATVSQLGNNTVEGFQNMSSKPPSHDNKQPSLQTLAEKLEKNSSRVSTETSQERVGSTAFKPAKVFDPIQISDTIVAPNKDGETRSCVSEETSDRNEEEESNGRKSEVKEIESKNMDSDANTKSPNNVVTRVAPASSHDLVFKTCVNACSGKDEKRTNVKLRRMIKRSSDENRNEGNKQRVNNVNTNTSGRYNMRNICVEKDQRAGTNANVGGKNVSPARRLSGDVTKYQHEKKALDFKMSAQANESSRKLAFDRRESYSKQLREKNMRNAELKKKVGIVNKRNGMRLREDSAIVAKIKHVKSRRLLRRNVAYVKREQKVLFSEEHDHDLWVLFTVTWGSSIVSDMSQAGLDMPDGRDSLESCKSRKALLSFVLPEVKSGNTIPKVKNVLIRSSWSNLKRLNFLPAKNLRWSLFDGMVM